MLPATDVISRTYRHAVTRQRYDEAFGLLAHAAAGCPLPSAAIDAFTAVRLFDRPPARPDMPPADRRLRAPPAPPMLIML